MMTFFQKNQMMIFTSTILIAIVVGIIAPRFLAYLPGILGLLFVGTLGKTLKDIFPLKLTFFVLGFIVVCLAGALHAPDIAFSLERAGKIAIILLSSLLFIAVCRYKEMLPLPYIFNGMMILHLVLSVFLLLERLSDHQILDLLLGYDLENYVLNRAFVVFSMWSIFLAFICRYYSKNILCAVVILSSAVALSSAVSQTAQLSFVVGIIVLLAVPTQIKWVTRSLLAGIIAFSLSFPFLITPIKNMIPEQYLLEGLVHEASIIHRLEVWQHSAQKTFEKPVFGHGIEALRFLKSNQWMEHQRADSILHSHNAPLQIWIEFGGVGILFACVLLSYLFWRIEKVRDLMAQRLYFTMLLTCLCISFTGYGLWQSWQLGLFLFFSALSILAVRHLKIA